MPFFVRVGKCLPVTATEVLVSFKRPPRLVLDETDPAPGCYCRFRFSPEVVLALGTKVKKPGELMVGESVELVAHYQPPDEMEPYERLLGDAANGDATLFAREDSVEAAWRVVDPILGDTTPPFEYEGQHLGAARGSAGFDALRRLARSQGQGSVRMTPFAPVVFLLDVDNTLLDNDQMHVTLEGGEAASTNTWIRRYRKLKERPS